MFRYYALAAICYGYLRDVETAFFSLEDLQKHDHCHRHPRYEEFRQSVWFRRGWTLQELIAPRFFVFLSRSWDVIGTKADLAELLEAHLGIPATVLRLLASSSEFSISQRMSWFQDRQTKRPEDEAYCLLGLFEIHMPPLYGEGTNAFRRMQEEIMKQASDTTLFAWTGNRPDSTKQCLFAAKPADFSLYWKPSDAEVVYAPPRRTQAVVDAARNDSALGVRADINYMTFVVTPAGVRANVPIFTWLGRVYGDLYWYSRNGRRVFLALEPDSDNAASSPDRLSYQVCQIRLTMFDVDPYSGRKMYSDGPPSWKEVLIRHRPPLRRAPGQLPDSATSMFIPAIPMQLTFDAPVRFPEVRIRQFLLQSDHTRFEIRGAGVYSPWTADSNLPTAYVFVEYGHSSIIQSRAMSAGTAIWKAAPA